MKSKSLIDKLKRSTAELEEALKFTEKAKKQSFYLKGIAKSYEVCFEYAWKYLQQNLSDEGIESYSPKEAIKHAGKIGLIDDVEKWLNFLQDRNFAVHDYLGISDEEYLKTVQTFYREVKRFF